MKKDIILILEGGCMLGVFGAGVVTSFQKLNLYPRIHSIYASSAGAHDSAYFLAKQTKLASTIYYEDLIDNKFIKLKNILPYIFDIIMYKFNKKHKIHEIINIDYLINIEKNIKKINIKKLKKNKIPFYIKVFDIKKLENTYLDGMQGDILKKLKASSTATPFYSKYVKISGKSYIDGSSIRSKDFLDIIKINEDKKIIYVINHNKNLTNEFIFSIFESFLLLIIFGYKIALKKLINIYNYPSLNDISSKENVFLITNDINNSISCTIKKEILKLYKEGMKRGEKIINKIK